MSTINPKFVAEACLAQAGDVGADEVDDGAGGFRLGAGFFQRLLYVVDSGDLPAVLGQVDRGVAGTATEFEGFAGGQRIFASMRVRRLSPMDGRPKA